MADNVDKAELLVRYRAAMDRFDAASRVLTAHMTNLTMPTAAELRAEQEARDDLVKLRRAIWRGWA